MNIEQLINHHKQELEHLKARMYEAEQRMKEVNVILMSLERAQTVHNQQEGTCRSTE